MENRLLKAECVLRMLSLALAAAAALLVGLDTQTKTVLLVRRKATAKDLDGLWTMTLVTSATAGYHLLQLFRCMAALALLGRNPCRGSKSMAWFLFLSDQAALVAVFGVDDLQWSKLCNIYTRFCEQVAGGMLCGLTASLAMAVVSAVSAYHLFRLYPRCRRSSVKAAPWRWLPF
ncbi:hypothetical protein GW17_00038918 [Ensete ventricosum]|nr:hypothetical protein GW17_00038918 [Ensete ventricosum]